MVRPPRLVKADNLNLFINPLRCAGAGFSIATSKRPVQILGKWKSPLALLSLLPLRLQGAEAGRAELTPLGFQTLYDLIPVMLKLTA